MRFTSFLYVLRKLVPELSQVSSLELESCQMDKDHCVSYPLRVNKRADHSFELVHSGIWGLCPVSSHLILNISVSLWMKFLV